MGYLKLFDEQTRIYVQTGMDNARVDAAASAQALGALLAQPVGYINNGTEGLSDDVGVYLTSSLGLKDVLNEYTLRTLDAKGPTLIVLHSAGNEDARKALLAGSLYDHRYANLSFVSLASPVGSSAMQAAVTQGQATYLGQVADWRDPVTYSKTAGTISIGSFVGGLSYGAVQGCFYGPLGCISGSISGAVVGGIPGALTFLGLTTYHSFEQYIAKPQTRSILFDWLRANSLASVGR